MKWPSTVVLILLSMLAVLAGAQASTAGREQAQDTKARTYWVDPSTGLMWTGKDNGSPLNWREAAKYCRDLRLAGYSDWRLATLDQLAGIHDPNARAPGEIARTRRHEAYPLLVHVKGNLFLSGSPWSSSPVREDRGRPPEFGWFFDFDSGEALYDALGYTSGKRALCVRASTAGIAGQPPVKSLSTAQDTQVRGYWIDPLTGLMWAGKDNFKDLTWREAVKYCQDLRIGVYTGWRLATLGELEGIYDRVAESRGENPRSAWHESEPMNFHVKGNLYLTGNQWSSPQIPDDRGHPSGYAWRFDFNEGRPFDGDETTFFTNKRALCVRRSGG